MLLWPPFFFSPVGGVARGSSLRVASNNTFFLVKSCIKNQKLFKPFSLYYIVVCELLKEKPQSKKDVDLDKPELKSDSQIFNMGNDLLDFLSKYTEVNTDKLLVKKLSIVANTLEAVEVFIDGVII